MKQFSMILSAVLVAGGALRARDAAGGSPSTMETKGKAMSYGETREFLAKHTELVELTNGEGARVAICPRVARPRDDLHLRRHARPQFRFRQRRVHHRRKARPALQQLRGRRAPVALAGGRAVQPLVRPGKPQNLDNWFTPPAFNEGAWKVVSAANEPLRHGHDDEASKRLGTQFHLDVSRGVRLLGTSDLKQMLGESAAKKIAAAGVKSVAYETDNRLTNRGADMTREKGLVSIWILGMMNCGPEPSSSFPTGRAAKPS